MGVFFFGFGGKEELINITTNTRAILEQGGQNNKHKGFEGAFSISSSYLLSLSLCHRILTSPVCGDWLIVYM